MKRNTKSSLLAALFGLALLACPRSASAQNVITIDPADPLTTTNATSVAEWNTNGDTEFWNTTQLTPTVSGGFLSGTTTTDPPNGDTTLSKNPFIAAFPAAAPATVTIDFRLRRPASDTTDLQVFWADTAGGFAAGRSVTLAGATIPTDGAFHVYRATLTTITTELRGFRIDATTGLGVALDFDYIRLRVASTAPIVDPPDLQRVNEFVSLGNWNIAGDQQGWTTSNVTGVTVAGGYLNATTTNNDSQVSRTGLTLDSTSGKFPIVEIRLRKNNAETSRIDLFWADASGGIAAVRKMTLNANLWPADSQFHILQFRFPTSGANIPNGNITGFRFDPISDNATTQSFSVDYIRIGRISTDTDMDGLADVVETNTGLFVDSTNAGTDPAKPDTDNDGFGDRLELDYGTNPVDPASFPSPAITSYTLPTAIYLRDLAITPNQATTANGTPVGFTVSPTLPAGLSLNASTGTLSGTPTALTPTAIYAVTATFSGGITSTYNLTITVRNPGIVTYSSNPSVRFLNASSTNTPTLVGPTPSNFAIAPALPDGLFLDPFTGAISGSPTVVSPATDYTVTASYTSYPDAPFILSIRVKGVPVFITTDGSPIATYTSIGEWESGAALDGWTFGNATGTAASGSLTVNATAGDPQAVRNGLTITPAADSILEIRMKQTGSGRFEIFWGDNNGGASAARSIVISPAQLINDGEFHVYQIRFKDVFDGNLTLLRLDPGDVTGDNVVIDYVRLGVAGPLAPIEIRSFFYDALLKEVTLSWASTSGTLYKIEASSTLATPWTVLETNYVGSSGTSFYLDTNIPPNTPKRFYRISRQ